MSQFCFNTFNQSPFVGGHIDLMTKVDAAAAAGFIFFGPDAYYIEAWLQDGGTLQALANRLAAIKKSCWEIAASLVLGDRAESLAAARKAMPIASVLEPTRIQINVGTQVDQKSTTNLAEICELLRPTGAKIAIEYLPFMPLRSIGKTFQLVQQLGLDCAGVLVDTWHHFRGTDNDEDLDALPLDALAYVQFEDAPKVISTNLTDETLNRRVFPGEGEFPLHRFRQRMKAKGFVGVVSVEAISAEWRNRDIFEFARRAYATSVPFWL